MSIPSQDLGYDDELGLYTWKKGDHIQISRDFNTSEFSCHCLHPSCVKQIISTTLIATLQGLRTDIGLPIGVNSGYRCAAYQADLAAKGYETAVGISQHQLGHAVDLKCSDLLLLVSKAELRFKAVGIGHTFIHVDERKDKIRRWRYSSL